MKKEYISVKGFYKGYKCDSIWELAFVVYNLDKGIKFSRNLKGFPYLWYGKVHYYYPDFVMQDGTFIEIKGVKTGKDMRKINNFPHRLKVLYKKEIQPYMNYMFSRYGNDATKIYDTYVVDKFLK